MLLHTLQDQRGFSEIRQRGMQLLWVVRGLPGLWLHVIWASRSAVGWTTPRKALETGQAERHCDHCGNTLPGNAVSASFRNRLLVTENGPGTCRGEVGEESEMKGQGSLSRKLEF